MKKLIALLMAATALTGCDSVIDSSREHVYGLYKNGSHENDIVAYTASAGDWVALSNCESLAKALAREDREAWGVTGNEYRCYKLKG